MVEHHGSDHDFVGARRVGQGEQPVPDTISASDREAGAMARQPFAIAWRVRIGRGGFRRFQRKIFALGAPHVMQFGTRGDAFRLRIRIGRYRRGAENGVRPASATDGLKFSR